MFSALHHLWTMASISRQAKKLEHRTKLAINYGFKNKKEMVMVDVSDVANPALERVIIKLTQIYGYLILLQEFKSNRKSLQVHLMTNKKKRIF